MTSTLPGSLDSAGASARGESSAAGGPRPDSAPLDLDENGMLGVPPGGLLGSGASFVLDDETAGAIVSSLRDLLLAGERFRHLIATNLRMGVTDAVALNCLGARGPMSAGELAEALSLTPGTITALLDRLESGGLARRSPAAEDRRRVVVVLTERGHAAAAASEQRLQAAVRSVASSLPAGSRMTLAQLAQALRHDLAA